MVLEASFATPTVILLVDQSGSMTTAYSGGTRWSVLEDALVNPTTGVVMRRQGDIRFGLTLFHNPNGSPACPTLTTVPPALNNGAAIALAYSPAQPAGATPTAESIQAVTQSLIAFAEPGPRYIILASDGEPNTCTSTTADGKPGAVAAAQAAFAAGIKLFFLSVGSGTVSAAHMQDMANAGIGLPVGGTESAPYWQAADATQMASAFDAITGALLTCDLTVNGEIKPEALAGGVIFLDGNRLALNDPNGWVSIDTQSFRLQGDACVQAKRAGGHSVTAEFGCDAAHPPGLNAEGGGVIGSGCSAITPAAFLGAAMVIGLSSVGWRRRRR